MIDWKAGRFCLLAMATSLLVPIGAGAKEGFGLVKKTAAVTRTTPPAIFLMGTRFAVKASGLDGDGGLFQRLETQLESELIGRDSRLKVGSDAQTLIEVSVLQNQLKEEWQQRTETRSEKVGTDAEGKAIYRDDQVTVNYKVVTHNFSVAYKITDRIKKASLDADSINIPFRGTFAEGHGAPAAFSLENGALNAVVDRIARRITPTREQIGVLLPKGRLEDVAGLAEAGLWSRYLETVEAMAPSPKAEDEAYRHYALGTAYEALGYEADDAATTLKYLEKADSFYNQAITAKPEEKYFSRAYDSAFTTASAAAPLERVKSALVSYRRIKDFQENYDVLLASLPVSEGGKDTAAAAPRKMNNAAVIQMAEAGLSEDIILNAIKGETETDFDVSPDGLVELSKGKVGQRIIAHLQSLSPKNKLAPKPAKTSS